jgi:hypothetical protein
VTDLKTGSLEIEVRCETKLTNIDRSDDVIDSSIGGLRTLEETGLTPPYLSSYGLSNAKKLVKLIGNHGITGIELKNHTEEVLLTSKASANIDLITRIKRQSIGSVEGRLESISVHRGSKFIVYHHITNKAITCNFNERLLDQVKDGLGRRVIASGEIQWNINGEPISVNVDRLRFLGLENELPTIEEIGGIDPDFTGGLSTAEYLEKLRGE